MLDCARARKLLDYDQETGDLYWRERPSSDFRRYGDWLRWNRNFAGRPAGTIGKSGYRTVGLDGKSYRAHHLVWLHQTGDWPGDVMDHINGDRLDNRLANLRVVTPATNRKNAALYRNNTSGVVGVYWSKKFGKWQALIGSGGLKHLGYYDRKEDAIAARRAAEEMHGFHENHGRPA